MRALLFLILMTLSASAQTISYFNNGFLRQPDAASDRAYLGIFGTSGTNYTPGANVSFAQTGPYTYQIIGAGIAPGVYVQKAGDTMTGELKNLSSHSQSSMLGNVFGIFSDMDSGGGQPTLSLAYVFGGTTNTATIKYYSSLGVRVSENLLVGPVATGSTFTTTGDGYFGSNASVVSGIFYGDGSGLTNIYSTNIVGVSVLWTNYNNTIFPVGLAGNYGGWTATLAVIYPNNP